MDRSPWTVVEVLDPTTSGVGHRAKTIRINGSEVRVKGDGMRVDFGPLDLTTVTVELLVDEIHFNHGIRFGDETGNGKS